MTIVRTFGAAAIACLIAGAAFAEGSSDPQNTQGFPGADWTSARAEMTYGYANQAYGSVVVTSPVAPRANDLESINLAR